MGIGTRLLNYLTPYKGLTHLFTGRNHVERNLLKVVSCAFAFFIIPTLVSHLYCRLTDKSYSLVPQEPHAVGPALRALALKRPLKVAVSSDKMSCLTHPGVYMEYFLAVSPYKPCGCTEFALLTEAENEYLKRFPEKERAYGRKRTASCDIILKEMGELLDAYAKAHTYENYTKKSDGYRAVHPQSIYNLCMNNPSILRTDKKKAKEPLKRLRQGLRSRNVEAVARAFFDLSEIPNSLPEIFFEAAFGDINEGRLSDTALVFEGGGVRVILPKSDPLFALAELYRDFPDADVDTLRNLCSYFYHEGFENPALEAREILPTLERGAHYVIHESTAYKIPKGRIA